MTKWNDCNIFFPSRRRNPISSGSLIFLSRRFLPPTTNNHRQYHTNLQQSRFNIRRLDLSFRVGRNRRIVLLIQAATFFVYNDGNRTQLWLAIRIGGISVEKELNALMILLILKWLIMPAVFFEMMEKEIDYASVMYLSTLRFPLIAFPIA